MGHICLAVYVSRWRELTWGPAVRAYLPLAKREAGRPPCPARQNFQPPAGSTPPVAATYSIPNAAASAAARPTTQRAASRAARVPSPMQTELGIAHILARSLSESPR